MASVAGFQLEETAQFGSQNWNSTPLPVIDTATEHTVTIPMADALKYYRLKKP